MPTFNTTEALKKEILRRSRNGIEIAQNQVYELIGRFLNQYYNEFTPVQYERTYQLLRSLVKSKVVSTGNGWEAEVYFDVSALKYMTGKWDGDQVFRVAAHGIHPVRRDRGGPVGGTAIWNDPIMLLDARAIEILKQSLIAAGIPVV